MEEDDELCDAGGRTRIAGIMPGDDGIKIILAAHEFSKRFEAKEGLCTKNLSGAAKGLASAIDAWDEYVKECRTNIGKDSQQAQGTETGKILTGIIAMYLGIIGDIAKEQLSPVED